MSEQIADVCDRCTRAVIKKRPSDSSGMVQFLGIGNVIDGYLLLMVDVPTGSLKPTFPLMGKRWCPECLIADLQEWLKEAQA